MHPSLDHLSQLLSSQLSTPITVTDITEIGSGFNADGFKLTTDTGKHYFMKRLKARGLGYEYPERRLSQLLLSEGMARTAQHGPAPIGVFSHHIEPLLHSTAHEAAELYHIQEFAESTSNYWERLQSRLTKETMDAEDEAELQQVVAVAAQIHTTKHPTTDPVEQHLVYMDGLRSLVSNPELGLALMSYFPVDSLILPRQEQHEYLATMLDTIRRFEQRHHRISALHGDFWGANLFFGEDGTAHAIDYSRIPWGDPGIDAGWWLSQYLWLYHETGNPYFKELGERFLSIWEEQTGDHDIREAATLPLGTMGIIYTTPRLYPNRDVTLARKFLDGISRSMRDGTIHWE